MSEADYSIFLADEEATVACGKLLGDLMQGHGLLTLQGNLGGGKTTFSRGMIQGMGHTGAVKSPTYTLVEPYEINGKHIMHYDLYRLADPEELEFLGMRDFLTADTLTLIEWPERGANFLPVPDLALSLQVHNRGRILQWQGHTPRGKDIALGFRQMLAAAGYSFHIS